jgi:hypothetical protein
MIKVKRIRQPKKFSKKIQKIKKFEKKIFSKLENFGKIEDFN